MTVARPFEVHMWWFRPLGMQRPASTRSDAACAQEVTVHTGRAAGAIVVDVSGRLTVDSCPHLRPVLHGAIAAAPPAGVVVDLAAVSYLDTSAIATLIEAARLARDQSIRVRVVGLAGAPRLLAETTELDRIFHSLGSEVEVA